uniref:Uncharacterized protein n=1 Tax=Anguilla anguilla TaxID=7936 RepID=A0A0E9U372_ANGAN
MRDRLWLLQDSYWPRSFRPWGISWSKGHGDIERNTNTVRMLALGTKEHRVLVSTV